MAVEQAEVGRIDALWRYPVKSMAGERRDAVTVTDRGLRGDRAYALVDRADGKVATAKNPRKWPRLLQFSATLPDDDAGAGWDGGRAGAVLPPVLITTPEGAEVSSADPDVEQSLTLALGRDVALRTVEPADEPGSGNQWAATSEEYWPDLEGLDLRDTVTDFELPAGTFFDSAVVHVLTTATLARMAELHPGSRMDPRRFRPNVVVDTAGRSGFAENDWVGRTLRLGDEVRLTVTGPCGRCVMVTLAQDDLPKDTGILRSAAQHNRLRVGVYASVQSGGRVRNGDPVMLE
jgi:uncharacterized protein